jgi:hypothetical protein
MATIEHGTYEATDPEREAVESLLSQNGRRGSVTRDGIGNTGRLRVESGGQVWLIDETGNVEEVKA